MPIETVITLITGGVISFGFGLLAFYIHAVEAKREACDKVQIRYMQLSINLSMASLELSEAVAIAQKNGRCNGETATALESTRKIKDEYRSFVAQQCAASLQ